MLGSAAPRSDACTPRCRWETDTSVINTARTRIVALALAVSACVVVGCGGSDDSAKHILDQTFSGGKSVHSGDLAASVTLDAKGTGQIQGPVTIKLEGPFESQGRGKVPKFAFTFGLAAAGQSFSAGATSTGTALYVVNKGNGYQLPDNAFSLFKQVYARSPAGGKKAQGFGAFGIHPQDWLQDAKKEGDADVAGTPTTHISAGVDVPKLLTDVDKLLQRAAKSGAAATQSLPGASTPAQRKRVADAISNAHLDVYTGKDDRILRRLTVKLTFALPAGSQQAAGGISGGTLTFDLRYGQLNRPQAIAAPAKLRPISEISGQLQKLFALIGGLGGNGAAGGTGTSTTPAPTPAPSGGGAGSGGTAQEKYLACLQKARGNVAEAQKCASLLNG